MPSKTHAQTDSPESIDEDKGQKLQKVLANLGLGSRRKMERWIEEGRVTVDGSLATLGDRIRAGQSLRLDGKPLEVDASEQARVLLYHKPVREVCSRDDPEGRKTVFERLPKLKLEHRFTALGIVPGAYLSDWLVIEKHTCLFRSFHL